MKTSIKLALVSSIGSVMALANSWNKAKGEQERLKTENETLESLIKLNQERSDYISSQGRKFKKEVVSDYDNRIALLNEKLSELKNQVSSETILDHLDKLTQDLMSNYLEIIKKNFGSFWEFFSKLDSTAQLIMMILIGSLLTSGIIYLKNKIKTEPLVQEKIKLDKEEKLPIIINISYNKEGKKIREE